MVSILQISDLHRDPDNPIPNAPLLESLEVDRRRYLTGNSRIKSPELIIVTGDIIQGVSADRPDAASALRAQYAEAHDFLARLADSFVGGDRNRVVVVPGNHDVSAPHTMKSARRLTIAADRRRELISQLFSPNSRLRWSWSDLELLEIFDTDAYDRRMEAFCEFYGEFYNGTRSYDIDPSKQFDIFSYPDHNVVLVGFSSCYNNDILNKQGAINPACIATVGSQLRAQGFAEQLRIAVWHHNTEGLPMQSDYMDADILQHLIDGGFSLGLHGHQHRPQFLDTRFKYGGDRRITVISAGTLCGGPSYRFARSYNLIEIDCEARAGRLHLREMQNAWLEYPIWGRRPMPPDASEYLQFQFDAPPAPLVTPDAVISVLLEAQKKFDEKDFPAAAAVVRELANTDGLARRILVESLHESADRLSLLSVVDPPQSPSEAIYLMDALWAEGRKDRLNSLLDEEQIAKADDPSVVELRDKYRARLRK